MFNPFDEDLKPGDKLTFTEEVEFHLADLGIDHSFAYGDELVVVAEDQKRKFPICITDPRDMTWKAWIFRTIAERAREVWLKDAGFAPPPTIADYNDQFKKLSPEDRIAAWEDLRQTALSEFLAVYRPPSSKNKPN